MGGKDAPRLPHSTTHRRNKSFSGNFKSTISCSFKPQQLGIGFSIINTLLTRLNHRFELADIFDISISHMASAAHFFHIYKIIQLQRNKKKEAAETMRFEGIEHRGSFESGIASGGQSPRRPAILKKYPMGTSGIAQSRSFIPAT